MTTRDGTSPRPALTTERVLLAAVDLADRDGLGALTMRRLGAELGVEAMSLYKHVANKEAILDGVVEYIVGQIAIPGEGTHWKDAMRQRAFSARAVLAGHSWAIGLLETRSAMGPGAMRYLDASLGSLRSAGFTIENAVHAVWLLDSYVYGHVVQETSLSAVSTSPSETESAPVVREQAAMAGYPHLAEAAERAMASDYSIDGEFRYGLNLILDALVGEGVGLGDAPAGQRLLGLGGGD